MGEMIIVQRTASAAKFCRGSVVKKMYPRIFEWIVTPLNQKILNDDSLLIVNTMVSKKSPLGGDTAIMG
jgi:myosin heavy subunit